MVKIKPKISCNESNFCSEGLLDRILSPSVEKEGEHASPHGALVGECIEETHPILNGRVLVRWQDPKGIRHEKWLPVVSGIVVRTADRILMIQPGNWPEPLVAGVIDGLDHERERPTVAGATIEIKRDETVTVVTDDGTPLMEISPHREGPKLKVLNQNVDLEVPGRLRMRAESIELQAKKGEIKITTSDDVIVKGEIIHLN